MFVGGHSYEKLKFDGYTSHIFIIWSMQRWTLCLFLFFFFLFHRQLKQNIKLSNSNGEYGCLNHFFLLFLSWVLNFPEDMAMTIAYSWCLLKYFFHEKVKMKEIEQIILKNMLLLLWSQQPPQLRCCDHLLRNNEKQGHKITLNSLASLKALTRIQIL